MKQKLCLHAMIALTFIGWPLVVGGPLVAAAWARYWLIQAGYNVTAVWGYPAAIGTPILLLASLYLYVYHSVDGSESDDSATFFALAIAVAGWPLVLMVLLGLAIYHSLFHPAMECLERGRSQPAFHTWSPGPAVEETIVSSSPRPMHAWRDPASLRPSDGVEETATVDEFEDDEELLVLPEGPTEWDE